MKVNPLFGSLGLLGLARKASVAKDEARAEKDPEGGGNQYSRQQNDDQEHKDFPEQQNPEEFQRTMAEAVAEFQLDPQAQASGISASAQGSGPGLKVVVKDASGGVIRQFSGDEFLKLRESVQNGRSVKKRGKILDQKF